MLASMTTEQAWPWPETMDAPAFVENVDDRRYHAIRVELK
jgi:hypothetical protein